jgi:hypothetical protein
MFYLLIKGPSCRGLDIDAREKVSGRKYPTSLGQQQIFTGKSFFVRKQNIDFFQPQHMGFVTFRLIRSREKVTCITPLTTSPKSMQEWEM